MGTTLRDLRKVATGIKRNLKRNALTPSKGMKIRRLKLR